MGILNNENLFLLEFLVEDVQLDKGKCDCMQQKAGELCVGFQFLDNTELDVCERDFSPDKKFTQGNTDSRTGKSCLFSLTPTQAKAALESFDLNVHVHRKTEPEKTIIGTVSISALEMLQELLHSNEESPAAKVLQDTFKLKDTSGSSVGKIGVYVRLSCYGKMIITQFQMNLDDKSVIFKDRDGRSLYRYKKSKRSSKGNKIEDLTQNEQDCDPSCNSPRPGAPNINCPSQPCFPNGNAGHGIPLYQPGLPSAFDSPYGAPPPNFGAPSCAIGGAWPPSIPDHASPFANMPPPSSFPQSNPNCPTQPCFPSNFNSAPSPGFPINSSSMALHKSKSKNKSATLQPDVGMFYPPWMGSQVGAMPAAGSPNPFAAMSPYAPSSPFESASPTWGRLQQNIQTTRFSVGLGGSPYDGGARGGGCKGGCGR